MRYRYRQVLSEGILPGSYILTILATDVDDHAQTKLKYYLTGIGADKFSLDIDNGYLKTARSLDRENQTKYLLIAHVQDREHTNWECSSQVELIVSDLNDNPPIFSSTHYSVAIPEDVDVGTLVTKVHATDADIGKLSKKNVHYFKIMYGTSLQQRTNFFFLNNTMRNLKMIKLKCFYGFPRYKS